MVVFISFSLLSLPCLMLLLTGSAHTKESKKFIFILSHSQGDSDLSMHSCVVLFYALAFFFTYCIVSPTVLFPTYQFLNM